MATKLVNTLNPEYIKDFSCIGSACEDTCCAGWRVNIDEDTYKKYQRVKNPEMKFRLNKYVIRNRSNPTRSYAAKIKMEHDKCSFLSKDGWCDIQSKLGEEYLSNTCAIYPRRINIVNQIIERSLTVSCPEAARLILLREGGIDFEQGKETISIREFSSIINTSTEKIIHWKDCIDEYRYLTILILQNRKYSIEERLLILGMFYNQLEDNVTRDEINEIPNVLGEYLKSVEDLTFKGAFKEISSRLDIQLKLCRELVVLRLNQGISSTRYLECSREMMLGLKIEACTSDEELQDIYKFSYNQYYVPFMQQHEYMIENYLVNYVFKNCMPIDCDMPFESYARMILHYSLIKLHLVGMANHNQGLTSDLVIKLVQSISKTFEHNPTYLEKIMSLIKENNILNLTYTSILINN